MLKQALFIVSLFVLGCTTLSAQHSFAKDSAAVVRLAGKEFKHVRVSTDTLSYKAPSLKKNIDIDLVLRQNMDTASLSLFLSKRVLELYDSIDFYGYYTVHFRCSIPPVKGHRGELQFDKSFLPFGMVLASQGRRAIENIKKTMRSDSTEKAVRLHFVSERWDRSQNTALYNRLEDFYTKSTCSSSGMPFTGYVYDRLNNQVRLFYGNALNGTVCFVEQGGNLFADLIKE